jgi:Na+/melibiose symporter-like transporter
MVCAIYQFHHHHRHQSANNGMGASITGVVVAGCFSVLVALIHSMRKENRKDHGEVHSALGRIEQKIDGHTENHK